MAVDPRLGTRFAGYRIERLIGRGGMGVVYAAEQLSLGRIVALKLIAPEFAQDPSLRTRFEGEARLAASLDHPNIVPVFEAGEHEGVLFLAMRLVDGTDLRTVLADGGRLDPARASRITSQVAAALDAAHAHGLVHRDVKPANILLTGSGESEHAYLGDFGLTKQIGAAGQTSTGAWVGTLKYVAPEQVSGQPVDARSDVYALGCVLYEMLTGDVPFPRDSDVAAMFAHVNDPPPQPSRSLPGLEPQFDAVIERALAKRPSDRYPSAGDLARAAEAAAVASPPQAPERTVAVGAAAPASQPAQPQWQQADQPSWPPAAQQGPGRRAIWIAVAAVVAALAVAGVVLALALGGGDSGDGGSSGSTAAQSQPATPDTTGRQGGKRFPYPQSAIDNFVNACARTSGGKRNTCKCIVGELQQTVPFDQFAAADQAVRQGKPLPRRIRRAITAATAKCRTG